MANLQNAPLDQLHPHPDNPRLQLREDVVERLTAEITANGFGPEHAILARPIDGGLQVVSGHHRFEAARRAGLAEVPAWVREMDDDEAFMLLVLSNTQGELSPLEIGMHALKAVPLAQGKSGSGLKAYAERLGRTGEYVGQLRSAAFVVASLPNSSLEVADRAKHLYEISKAPRETWSALLAALVKRGWTVADAQHHVQQIKAFDIPDEWAFWLPLQDVVAAHLDTREFSPRTVVKLIAAAEQTVAWIQSNATDPAAAHTEFTAWLRSNKGNRSWEPRAVAEYLQKLIASQFVVEGWHHGNWRDHFDTLDDGTVGLLITDPPYGQGFQSDYRLDRRVDRKHQTIANDATPEDAEAELLAALEAFAPKLADQAHILVFCSWAGEPGMRETITKAGYTVRGSLIWDKQATGMGDPDTTFAPAHERILHAVKGSPPLYRRAADVLRHRRCDSSRHPTEKPVPLLRELIEATTAEGQLVADPFGGVASVPVAAKDVGRRWWGCEIDAKYHAAGEERLS